jgi:ABC-type proline/glycine betaine transport system permease subunit
MTLMVLSGHTFLGGMVMDLFNELFGTFSGLLSLAVILFMIVAMPIGIWWAMNHPAVSPCEEKDHEAHPDER